MRQAREKTVPIGERIRKARLAKKLSKSELARRVGVPRRYIQRWENEGVVPTKEDGRDSLVRELGLNPSDFPQEPDPGTATALRSIRADLAAVRKTQRSFEARLQGLEAPKPRRKKN